MKIKNDIIWATLLIGTGIFAFYFGTRTERIKMEDTMTSWAREKSDRIRALEIKIDQLSEELTSRGIYSYPQAHIVSSDSDSTSVVLITLNGRETIPNLDIEKRSLISFENGTNDQLNEQSFTTNIGNLTLHNPVAFEIGNFKKRIDINLIYRSGRKQWHQYITARKTSEGEIKTFWVITNEDMEVIDKHIDEGFPTDNDENFIVGTDKKMKFSEIQMNSVFNPEFLE